MGTTYLPPVRHMSDTPTLPDNSTAVLPTRQRPPAAVSSKKRNVSAGVYFVLAGCRRRRSHAYRQARLMQQELGLGQPALRLP